MATSAHYTFNGVQFCLTAGTNYMDGVTVKPDDHNVADPAVIEGLKQALAFYPLFYSYSYLENETQYYRDDSQLKRHLRNVDDERLAEDIKRFETLVGQDTLPLTEVMYAYGQQLLFERQRRKDKAAKELRATSQPARAGYVYLLNEINGQHFKIGRTIDPKERMKTFGVKLPYKVQLDVLIETSDMYTLEAQLHAKFADKRVDGEWFALTPADVDYVKSLAVQS